MSAVRATEVPSDSALQPWLPQASFFDAFQAALTRPDLTPTQIFVQAARATPRWVSVLMSLRNGIVRRLGLKDVGHLHGATTRPDGSCQVGDRLGIFSVYALTRDELVLGIDDRHLDVRVSVMKSVAGPAPHYVVTTVVKVHNLLGRAYMLPVARIHPRVVRALMRRADV